jgi:putative membrane protein
MEKTEYSSINSESEPERISVELSSRRTEMSLQRTRMAADRTLMAVIRTSLSLIGFGFTIFQVFQKLVEVDILKRAHAPGHFGIVLVSLGIAALVLGMTYHVRFMLEMRAERQRLRADGLIHGESSFPVSQTLIIAALLLALGLLAAAAMVFKVGPLGP